MSKSPGKIEGWLATCVASNATESWRVAILFNMGLSNKLISIFKSSFVAACKMQSLLGCVLYQIKISKYYLEKNVLNSECLIYVATVDTIV